MPRPPASPNVSSAVASPGAGPSTGLPASPWRRLMCTAYESVLLFGVVWFFGYAFSALAQFKGEPGAARSAFQVYMVLLLGGYFTLFWSAGRRTLPMKTMAVRLVTREGGPVSVPRAAWRYAVAVALLAAPLAAARQLHAATALLVLLPFAWVLVDRQRRTLWDVAAGTRLVND